MHSSKIECDICKKSLNIKKSIKCNICDKLSHYKCNFLNFVECQNIKNTNHTWQCISCSKKIFPFVELNDYRFNIATGSNTSYTVDSDKLVIKPPSNLSSLYNLFNDYSSNNNENLDNDLNCKYYDINDLNNLNTENNSSLSLFHLNISSLSKHIDSLQNLLTSSKINFDVIAISESRLNKDNISSHNINLQNYSFNY